MVVTGASSGIGAAASLAFAKKGARVVMVARNQAKLESAREDLAGIGKSEIATCDVSDKEQVSRMAGEVLGKFGQVDILVNNAGYAVHRTVSESTVQEIESQTATNYLGMVYCTKCFLPGMLERRAGHIVNVASVAASMGLPGMAAYCASKHAMLGFSEGLRHELYGTGVGVTVVSPITVRTRFFDHPSFAKKPSYRYAVSPERVARSIVAASSSPRLEIIVPQPVRVIVWLKQTIPYILGPILGSSFRRSLNPSGQQP